MTRKRFGNSVRSVEKNPNENLFLAGVRTPTEKNRLSCIDADRIQKLTCAAVVALLFALCRT